MAEENQNKLSNEEAAEGTLSVPLGVEHEEHAGREGGASHPMEGRTRRGRSVATLDVREGPFAELSVDTFAVPSERPLERNEDPERKLTGPEPAIFGGTSPDNPSTAIVDPDAAPADEEAKADRIGGDLDEAVRTGDLLADVPQIDYVRILRSTPFLLGAMIACLVVATLLVNLVVQTETYVRTSIRFNNYDKLNEQERAELQTEIGEKIRSLPLRRRAWDLLQKRDPSLRPGFLDSGLTFYRLDAVKWLEDEGVVLFRVDSEDPSADMVRLNAVNDAFFEQMDDRNRKKDEFREQLKTLQQTQIDLAQQDEKLKKQIETLSPKAERYVDLKQSLQTMERFLEVADESNPMRIVALQQISGLTKQVEEAKKISAQRDQNINARIAVQKKTEETATTIEQMKRRIELFPWPDPPSAKTLTVRDTRDTRKLIQRVAWISIIALFGLIIFVIHLYDQRVAETARRERREKLKAQKQQLEQEES